MSNWGTAVRKVAEGTQHFSTKDQDTIKRGIVSATGYLGKMVHLWKQKDSFTLGPTVVDQAKYALSGASPENLGSGYVLESVDGRLFYDLNSDATERWEINEVSRESLEMYRAGIVNANIPTHWAPAGDNIDIYPATGDILSRFYGRGIFVPGALVAKYAASAWGFFESDGTTALTDTFTNFWFEDPFNMLVERAKIECWMSGEFTASQADIGKAQALLDDHMGALLEEERRKITTGQSRPLNLGAYARHS